MAENIKYTDATLPECDYWNMLVVGSARGFGRRAAALPAGSYEACDWEAVPALWRGIALRVGRRAGFDFMPSVICMTSRPRPLGVPGERLGALVVGWCKARAVEAA